MRTIRCQKCRQMYEYDGLPPKFCPTCSTAENEIYKLVRNYVKVNRGADIMEVSEHTGVSRTRILQYIKEGSIEIISPKFKA